VTEEEQGNGESSSSATPLGVERWVGTGDVGLDEVLGGGIRTGVLTEISGERYVNFEPMSPADV
jgi:RecA/RadA recombinase